MEPTNPYDSPTSTGPQIEAMSGARTLTLRRLDVFSVGKIQGALFAVLGLIGGAIISLISVLGIALGNAGGGDVVFGGIITGLGALIFIPLIYGMVGFIGGVLVALLYNFLADTVGGIRFDVEG